MKKHILVVDDEIGALTLIGIMLERGGFGVDKAKNAARAIAALSKQTPDMFILDVMMPGTDGIKLCRILRGIDSVDTIKRELYSEEVVKSEEDMALIKQGLENVKSVPVLILSARGDADSIMRGIEAGANDYLPKPILHHDLVAKVHSMLDATTP